MNKLRMLVSGGVILRIFIRWLMVLVFALETTTYAVAAPPQVPKGGYPDVWYRLYEWPTHVFSMFFSDKQVWRDEPIVILIDGFQEEGKVVIAEGFFSKKRRKVTMTFDPDDEEWRYSYVSTGKRMAVRRIPEPELRDQFDVTAFKDGGYIRYTSQRVLNWEGYKGNDPMYLRTPSVVDIFCEPLSSSLRRVDRQEKVVWDKLTTRYYDKNEIPPYDWWSVARCLHATWLSKGASFDQNDNLRLPDNTLLTTSKESTYIVRLRLNDGTSGPLPPNLMILDTAEVIAVKQEMVAHYLQEMEKIKRLPDPEYRKLQSRLAGPEKIYREMASHFFKDLSNQGDKK